MIKRNQYLEKLISKKENGLIKIITGLRRSGKSYLLKEIYFNHLLSQGVKKEQVIIIDLDDDQNIKYRNPLELSTYIRSLVNSNESYYVIIDEIQKVITIDNPYVEGDKVSFVDILLGLHKIKNIDLYVTGSNSKMLSSDILTEFRDRGDEIKVYPLTFKEIYDAFRGNKSDVLRDYLVYGGMPLVYEKNSDNEKRTYLKNLYKQTYLKDIIEQNKINNKEILLEELLHIVSSNIGSLMSYNKLAKTFKSIKKTKISAETIKRYLDFFIDAFLMEKAMRFDIKGRKYIDGPVKYFYSDIGIRNAILNFRQLEENHMMENIIYNELISRGYSADVGRVEYNYKNKENISERKQLEVDFIVNKNAEKVYIQSVLYLDNADKKKQELASLLKINDSFKKIVVVKDNIKQ